MPGARWRASWRPAGTAPDVGLWYENFEQISDEEVHDLLAGSEHDAPHHA